MKGRFTFANQLLVALKWGCLGVERHTSLPLDFSDQTFQVTDMESLEGGCFYGGEGWGWTFLIGG